MGSLSVALRATVRWRTSHPGTVSVPEEDPIEVQGRGAASGRLLEADHRRGAADAPLPRPEVSGWGDGGRSQSVGGGRGAGGGARAARRGRGSRGSPRPPRG